MWCFFHNEAKHSIQFFLLLFMAPENVKTQSIFLFEATLQKHYKWLLRSSISFFYQIKKNNNLFYNRVVLVFFDSY